MKPIQFVLPENCCLRLLALVKGDFLPELLGIPAASPAGICWVVDADGKAGSPPSAIAVDVRDTGAADADTADICEDELDCRNPL